MALLKNQRINSPSSKAESPAGPGLTVTFALHAYQLELGKYPETLSQLVPAYLTKVFNAFLRSPTASHYDIDENSQGDIVAGVNIF